MQQAVIIQEPREVEARLTALGVTKDELTTVVQSAVAARNDAVENDPSNAAGWMAYCYGTRCLRDIYRAKKWDMDRTDGVESVVNPETGIKLVYQNASCAGDVACEPHSVSVKGAASKHLVNSLNGDLFREWSSEAQVAGNSVWYLFVHAEGDSIGAELSCPRTIEGGQFRGFVERILLVVPGDEWNEQEFDDDAADEQDFNVNVSRR